MRAKFVNEGIKHMPGKKLSSKQQAKWDELQSLDRLCKLIEDGLQGYGQNYNVDVEYDDGGDGEVFVKQEYNVDWEDNEERHPWVEITVNVNLKNKTIKGEGNLSSKNGDIDEDASRSQTYDVWNVDFIADSVIEMVHEIGTDIYSAGENANQSSNDDDDWHDEDEDDEDRTNEEREDDILDYARVFMSKLHKLGFDTSVESDSGYTFIAVDKTGTVGKPGWKDTCLMPDDYNQLEGNWSGDGRFNYKGLLDDKMIQELIKFFS